jgi:hypothetical protein
LKWGPISFSLNELEEKKRRGLRGRGKVTSRDTSVGVIAKGTFVSVWGHVWVGELLNVKATFGRRIHSGDVVGDFSRSVL